LLQSYSYCELAKLQMKQLTILFFTLTLFSCSDRNPDNQSLLQPAVLPDATIKYIGPEKGYLVIGGGDFDKPILENFSLLLKDKEAKIVIITTALPDEALNEIFLDTLKKYFIYATGTKNIKILNTRDTAVANSDKFLNPIKEAKGVWFLGGRQWRLADAYLGTKVLDELNNLLKRGGVIGGSSAGGAIMGSFLARGDTRANLIIDGDHKVGFNFLRKSAIDVHLLERNRLFDMLEIRKKYPDLLGIGIDQATAIVVHKNEFEVIGNSCVAIYDGTFWLPDNDSIINLAKDSERFYFLSKGDKYDLEKRKPIREDK
jgi:cyanophycinase